MKRSSTCGKSSLISLPKKAKPFFANIEALEDFFSSCPLPSCRVAIGSLYYTLLDKPINKCSIDNLPRFMKTFSDKYLKSPKRLSSLLNDFKVSNHEFVTHCTNIFASNREIVKKHEDFNFVLASNDLCKICFDFPNSCNANKDVICSQESMKLQLSNFVSYQMSQGERLFDIHKSLVDLSTVVCKSFERGNDSSSSSSNTNQNIVEYDSVIVALKKEILSIKKKNKETMDTINRNHSIFCSNLEENAAFVQYYLNISQSELKVLDKQMFCISQEDIPLTDIVKRYPKLSNVSPQSTHENLFYEFLSHVLANKKEPNFGDLGAKYKLTGAMNGCSKSRQIRLAQSVCYNKLLMIKDSQPEQYSIVEKVVIECVGKRKGNEKYPLFDDLCYPRFPSKVKADHHIQRLNDKGDILLGEPQVPESHSTYDYKTHKKTNVYSCSRKNSFQSIREHFLNHHAERRYLRARQQSYYDSLTKIEVLKLLAEYGVYYSDFNSATIDTDSNDSLVSGSPDLEIIKLRRLVQETETTRHYLVWYDHSTIGGVSYILFNFQYIYSPAVYCRNDDDMSSRELQRIIEKPQLYYLGVSPPTTAAEEGFTKMRLDDIKSLSVPITRDGIVYHDVYRFTIGDQPVRCVESGHNKSGYWRVPTTDIKIEDSIIPFHKIVSSKHYSIDEQRNFANKGGFYDNPDNFGKSLQDQNPKEICKLRLKQTFKTKCKAEEAMKNDLKGVRRQHVLLKDSPTCPLDQLHIENLEVSPSEPLHDLKAVSKSILSNIPGKVKRGSSNVIKIANEVVSKHGDEKYHLKSNHNAEQIFIFILEITSHLQHRLFPEGLESPCGNCGLLFHISGARKCEKCLIVGIYRALLEIHVYGYQDHSKKTPTDVLRFYNLVYILYMLLIDFSHSKTDVDIAGICLNVYFVDVIKFLPVMYELHNLLSLNAGRHEADFKTLKKVVKNYTNMRHFTDKFLFHVLKKLEIKKYFNYCYFGEEYKTSVVSKLITHFFKKSPKQDIQFHISLFSNTDRKDDLYAHLQRISTFIVSNAKCGKCFMDFVQSSGVLIFHVSPDSQTYPPFPLYNILNSNADKILKTKQICFQQIKDQCFEGDSLSISKFLELIAGGGEITISAITQAGVSNSSSSHSTSNSYVTILDRLAIFDDPKNFLLLKHSYLTKCLAKIYGCDVADDLVNFDRLMKFIQLYQTQNKTLDSSNAFKVKYEQYIVKIRYHVRKLIEIGNKVDIAISTLSKKCNDELVSEDDDDDGEEEQESQICDTNDVYQLNLFRRKKEAIDFIKNSLEFESYCHRNISAGL